MVGPKPEEPQYVARSAPCKFRTSISASGHFCTTNSAIRLVAPIIFVGRTGFVMETRNESARSFASAAACGDACYRAHCYGAPSSSFSFDSETCFIGCGVRNKSSTPPQQSRRPTRALFWCRPKAETIGNAGGRRFGPAVLVYRVSWNFTLLQTKTIRAGLQLRSLAGNKFRTRWDPCPGHHHDAPAISFLRISGVSMINLNLGPKAGLAARPQAISQALSQTSVHIGRSTCTSTS